MATLLDYIYISNVYVYQKENLVTAYKWTVESLLAQDRINEISRQELSGSLQIISSVDA
jgi:hypothetical protein